jgi:copper oxidase (laccase) domain-containing protein
MTEAVGALKGHYGCLPEDLIAVIGPGLGPCCAEFRHFREEFPPGLWTYQARPTYFDLWRLSRDQLQAAGVPPAQIEVAGLCTRCHPQYFFSYRRDKITGRQGAVIGLK